jgi:hypothetical protein
MSHRGTLRYEAVHVDMQVRHPHSKRYLAQACGKSTLLFADLALDHPDADKSAPRPPHCVADGALTDFYSWVPWNRALM